MKIKRPVQIMVFVVVISDDVIASFIITNDSRLNTETYIKCIEEVVLS